MIQNCQLSIFIIYICFTSINIEAHEGDTTNKNFVLLQKINIQTLRADQAFSIISHLPVLINGVQNSQEILRYVPGLFISQHSGGGKAEQMFMRGFDIDHGTDIAINVDGMAVNMVSHAHGQGYADLHFVIPELIKNFQYYLGSYQAEHGDLNTAAAIEIQLKDTVNNFIKMEFGRYGFLRTAATWQALKTSKHNLYFGAEYVLNKGYFDVPQNFIRINAQLKYTATVNQNNSIKIIASHFNSKWNASGQIPEFAIEQKIISRYGSLDSSEGGNTSRSNLSVILNSNVNTKLQWINQIYYTNYQFRLFSNFTFFLLDTINGDEICQQEQRHLIGLNSQIHWHHYNKAGLKMLAEFGIQSRNDFINNSTLKNVIQRKEIDNGLLRLGDINIYNMAAYLKEKIWIGKKINIELGIRNDNFLYQYNNLLVNDSLEGLKLGNNEAIIFGIFSPKLIAHYYPQQKVHLYFKTGYGFHSNDARSMVRRSYLVNEAGTKFLPYSLSTDIGTNLTPYPTLLININAFHTFIEQEYVYVGDENIVETNGRTRRLGIGISLRYVPTNNLLISIDGNYTKSLYLDKELLKNFIPLAPVFTSTGAIIYKNEKWKANLNFRYMSPRPTNEENTKQTISYLIFDCFGGVLITPKTQVLIGIENILNENWNEAQFETSVRIKDKKGKLQAPINDLTFTAGTPINFFIKCVHEF